ncbi:MAG: hypothetical protein HBSIN02_07780 [Bacteroidia bacterium]|nr:MAG: hypothetical protein HBSIN02_07780 [Bacteroidia bacterium]
MLKAITARPGQLRFNGGATTIFQWHPGASNRFATATGSVNIFAHTSVGASTLLFFDFEAIGGNGPNQHIPTFTSINGDAQSTQDNDGFDHLLVNEAWLEFSLWNDNVTATVGKIDLTNYFDNNSLANDETSQFISAAFVNSAALPAPGSTPGIRIRLSMFSRLYIQLGISKVDNSGNDILAGLMKIGGAGFKLFPESQNEANLRVYGYLHPSNNGGGYGVSFDQNVVVGVSIFSRWNRNGSNLATWYPIREAWSAGTRWVTSCAGRKCVLSAAYGQSSVEQASLA